MRTLSISLHEVFDGFQEPARYKGAWGGRGSGKSHAFALMLIAQCVARPGLRCVCIREVQKTLKESSKRLIEDKLQELGIVEEDGFRVLNEVIETPGGGIISFVGMQDHNAESIKSLEGYSIAWVEEAQTLSHRSLSLLRPTIRAPGSELWFSWNPRRKSDAVDMMLRGDVLPTGAIVNRVNWSDNPWFPDVLEQERLDCLEQSPEQYPHIWEGEYAMVLTGAYYAKHIAIAKQEGRISRVGADPLMTIRMFVDIGGTGAKADAFTIWCAQFIGKEIRVIDHYEAVGQPLAAHVAWMRARGYTPEVAQIWLPHDGTSHDRVYDVSFEGALRKVGYTVTTVPNQGAGAAKARVESGRRLFNRIWFDAAKTQGGLDALGWYHEKRDEARNIGLGPEHDWASDSADSFGLMCIVAEQFYGFVQVPEWKRALSHRGRTTEGAA
ncbi:PBSX family phage terminase large subunit [Propionivibrio sp.]|uniref:PBSX family phage terminase large subunit n=1 Tax=Propionivibrio sp. TaxID=2212460 RepID=UPI003BF20BF5